MASTNEVEAITNLTQQIEDLSTNNDIILEVCANCGKEGTNMNTCNKCKAATYCNASCKKKHRKQHKMDCEKRVAELHEEQLERERRAAELHDRELFKEPPPIKDCDICMLPLPQLLSGWRYKSCCGKDICSGCIYAVSVRDAGVGLCPFCRTPTPTTDEEILEQLKKRAEGGDVIAIYNMGCYYANGDYGLPQDINKALEFWHRAAELGHAVAYYSIGGAYNDGIGVRRDEDKAKQHYYELAAIGGDVDARCNLGYDERHTGNWDRALKHFILAAGGGEKESLSAIQEMFKTGHATKEDYTKALRAYQAYLGEVKSAQRDEAAAAVKEYKYYEL